MRLLFVARAIDRMAGGVERTIISIMSSLAPRHDVSLLTWDLDGAAAFYPMQPVIKWYRLNKGDPRDKAGLSTIVARWSPIRRLVRNLSPDVIVCFQGGSFRSMQLYTAGLGIPLVAAERTAPTLYDHANSRALRVVEHLAFRFAKCITIQFERYRGLYPAFLHSRIVTIPNAVVQATRSARPDVPGRDGRWRLLSVGRLGYQKNYAVLIEAFARIAGRFPDWDLRIVGEGEGRAAFESQVAGMPSLRGRVSMPGTTTDVGGEYQAAHLFCLPSRWEGFPNALAEALAHGLPAVGFAECAGVPDLIEEGRNGALAAGNGDPATLADALAMLMGDAERRRALGTNAVVSVAPYQPAEIFKKWEDTLQACVGK